MGKRQTHRAATYQKIFHLRKRSMRDSISFGTKHDYSQLRNRFSLGFLSGLVFFRRKLRAAILWFYVLEIGDLNNKLLSRCALWKNNGQFRPKSGMI
jgi:hypothetical protein